MKTNYGRLLRWHLIFCVFYYLLQPLLLERTWGALNATFDLENLAMELAGFLIIFGYALFSYFVLHRRYGRPWYELALWLLLASVVAVGVRYLTQEVIAPVLIGFRNYPVGTSLLTYYLDNLYYLLLHGAIGVIAFLLEMTRWREAQQQALVVENQRTELAFLRSQINPHFLFNTLNNVYSLFFQQSDKALTAIERLTTMLRYGLYEKAEKVALDKELEHLQNFIELEQLRYDYVPDLHLDFPEDRGGVMVPPLLLITFVENAFKHGDLRKAVRIHLSIESGKLIYEVTNTKKEQRKDAVGGIGLENLRKRLELLYHDQHHIELTEAENTFRAYLQIELT